MKSGVKDFHLMSWSSSEFHENKHTQSYTLLQGIDKFVVVISMFLDGLR